MNNMIALQARGPNVRPARNRAAAMEGRNAMMRSKANEMDMFRNKVKLAAEVLGNTTSQGHYEQVIHQGVEAGAFGEQEAQKFLSEPWSPELAKDYQMQGLSADKRMDMAFRQDEREYSRGRDAVTDKRNAAADVRAEKATALDAERFKSNREAENERFEYAKGRDSVTDSLAAGKANAEQERHAARLKFDQSKLAFEQKQTKNSKSNLTPAQKSVDQAFGKEYADLVAGGGMADMVKNINQLNSVIKELGKSDTLTGPVVGNQPDFARAVMNPKSLDAEERVSEVVQRNLRIVLGAQFTEKEGSALIKRAYNPKLQESVNIQRLTRLSNAMQAGLEAKQAATTYYETNGTLQGFQGKLPSISDLDAAIDGEPGDKVYQFTSDGQKL